MYINILMVITAALVLLWIHPALADLSSVKNTRFENDEIILETAQLVFEQESGLAVASGQVFVTIKANGGKLEADQLTYNLNTGVITATGSVKLTTGQAVYEAGSVSYNLRDSVGAAGDFNGKVAGKIKNSSIKGEGLTLKKGAGEISKATLTRCSLLKPHYKFYAKKIVIDDEKVRLSNVILFFEGIPVFYFPRFTFSIDNLDKETFSNFLVGFDSTDGLWFDYSDALPINNHFNWDYNTRLATNSGLSFGVGAKAFGAISNHLNFNYSFKGVWTVKDVTTLNYNTPLASFTLNGVYDFTGDENELNFNIGKDTPVFNLLIDGAKSFSATGDQQLGFSLTRKYWRGWLGDWQLGILGRKVSGYDDSGQPYKGTYGGGRIDYRPNSHLTLSYLKLYSFSEDNYPDNLGDNILINTEISLGKEYSVGLSGSYNFDDDYSAQSPFKGPLDKPLKSLKLQFNKNTDCYTFSVSWDAVANTWTGGAVFKF